MYIDKNFISNCISEDKKIVDALSQLESVQSKVLFVVNSKNVLIGSLTDGDIRRALIKGRAVEDSVIVAARKEPITFSYNEARQDMMSELEELMYKHKIDVIPIVNNEKQVISLAKKSIKGQKKDTCDIKVVIMAGGKGTRLYPYTRVIPKPLIPVGSIPISERIIGMLYESGCRDFYMVVNYKKNMIKSYYNESEHDYNLSFYEEESYLGTGGGLKLLEKTLNDTFLMTNCDILILEDLNNIVEYHKKEKNDATMVCSLKSFEIPYGVVRYENSGIIESLEEKPCMSFYINTGYYILEKEVFKFIDENENIGMPDVLMRMRNAGLRVGMYPIGEDRWLDMGQFDSMSAMERKLSELGLD